VVTLQPAPYGLRSSLAEKVQHSGSLSIKRLNIYALAGTGYSTEAPLPAHHEILPR